MRRFTTSLAIAWALIACGGGSSGTSTTTTQTAGSETASTESAPELAQVSIDEVAGAVEGRDPSWAIFDANSRETYEQHHVPGATWVDYDALSQEQLPQDRSATLVFYCANEQCEASHVAARSAIGFGYENVRVMGAGIHGWIAAGKPVESSEAAATAVQ